MADRIGVMNFGRLLESGRPQDLYTRPATRFVATFLGAANLILARQGADGPRWGAWSAAHAPPGLGMPREREVVAVVRPEEIEIARSRESLSSSAIWPAASWRRWSSPARSSARASASMRHLTLRSLRMPVATGPRSSK